MERVIDFILENWKDLLLCFFGFLNFILLCFKKNKLKVVDSKWAYIVSIIPDAILLVENEFIGSDLKKQKAVDKVLLWIAKKFDLDVIDVASEYRERISDYIEDILACPQKKGAYLNAKND